MTAAELRAAADRLDELAGRATSGPWEFRPRRGFESVRDNPATIGFTDTAGYFVMLQEGTWATEGDMSYVAALPPEVGKALAAWLRQAAMDEWAHGRPECCTAGCDECDDNLLAPHLRKALAVAHLILGGTP